jgi:hypothetical protein
VIRILDIKYYSQSKQKMIFELSEILKLNCKFLVAGRVNQFGKFCILEEIEIPNELKDLFIPIDTFRIDISSTQLRNQ